MPGHEMLDANLGKQAVLCWACRLRSCAQQAEGSETCLLLQHSAEPTLLSACSPVIHTATFGPLQPGVTYFYQASLSQVVQACAQLLTGLAFHLEWECDA